MLQEKKIAIFYILEILKEYTDIDHPLTQAEIGQKLNMIYHIELERKSIAANLQILSEDLNFDINKCQGGGYYLGERELDETEIKFLIDAIFSSKIIPGKEAHTLAKKLSNNLSKYKRKDYNFIYKSEDISRTSNKELFYNIDIINEAIKNNKMISFKYLDYDELGNETERYDGFRYKVSPYFMINNIGKYYLVGKYYKYDNHTNYKMDYIKDIKIEDESLTPIKDVKTLGEKFKISEYINNHVYIFGGNVINAKLELISNAAVMVLRDWFGKQARIVKENDKRYAYIKSEGRALFYWLLQYQEDVVVVEPKELREKVINRLKKTLERYGEIGNGN